MISAVYCTCGSWYSQENQWAGTIWTIHNPATWPALSLTLSNGAQDRKRDDSENYEFRNSGSGDNVPMWPSQIFLRWEETQPTTVNAKIIPHQIQSLCQAQPSPLLESKFPNKEVFKCSNSWK